MSISSEITSMGENLKKDYQSIANLGADLTNVDKNIENIAELLDGVYDNLPKTSFQEGTEITLSNTLKGKLDFDDGVVGIGQSSQETTTGKNKFEPSLFVGTTGITQSRCNVIIDDDEFVMECTGQDMYFGEVRGVGYTYVSNCGVKIDVSNQTSLYLYLTNTTFFSNYITAFDSNNVSLGFRQVASYKGAYTIPEGTSYVTLRFGRANAVSGETYRTKVMVVFGSTEDTNYEKYSGGYASPSPNWKQQIKSVKGVNLAKSKVVLPTTSGYADALLCEADLQPLTTYAISFEGIENNKLYCNEALFDLYYFTVGSGITTLITRTKPTISKSNATQYRQGGWIIFKNNGSGNPTANIFDNLQIEEGTTSTPYLPYNTIEEVVSGKNLLDIYNTRQAGYSVETNGITFTWNDDGSISISGTSTSANAYVDIYSSTTKIIGKPGERITYCLLENTSNDVVCHIYDYADGTYKNNNAGTIIAGHTNLSNATGSLIRIIIPSNNVTINQKVYPIIVEGAYSSSNLPDYEPYITPQTYQLSLGDIELCGIGDYKDELIYDVDEDKVYKNVAIKKLVLDGNETITNDYTAFDISLPNRAILGEGAYCNYYTYDSRSSGMASLDNYTFAFQAVKVFIQNKDYSSVDSFKGWLNVNKPIIYYPLYTTQKTEITDTTLVNQIKALYYSHSLNGTTIITSNGNLPMIIKCRGLKGE